MFIAVEGPNGVGKTTLIKNLSKKGCKTLSSPNGTPLAKMLRPACRGVDEWSDLDPKIKFLLFSAARYDEYLRLVHNSQDIIISDRWWTSTYVYQCLLEGIDVSFMEKTIHEEEQIDMVVCLEADEDALVSRMKKERELNSSHGLCSWTKDLKKFREIIKLYDKLPIYLFNKGINFVRVDTTDLNEEEVLDEVWKEIQKIKYEQEVSSLEKK